MHVQQFPGQPARGSTCCQSVGKLQFVPPKVQRLKRTNRKSCTKLRESSYVSHLDPCLSGATSHARSAAPWRGTCPCRWWGTTLPWPPESCRSSPENARGASGGIARLALGVRKRPGSDLLVEAAEIWLEHVERADMKPAARTGQVHPSRKPKGKATRHPSVDEEN